MLQSGVNHHQSDKSYQKSMCHNAFHLEKDLIHVNHAGVGPWPSRSVVAAERFAQENMQLGSLQYPAWTAQVAKLRQQFAWLIAAPSPDDIAILKNTSEALSLVAFGLPWATGDNVVGIRQEFPSNRLPWQALQARYGVQWRAVDIAKTQDPETALIAACDASTRVLAVSAVQYASGFKLDLERLGRFCRSRDILFCIDAIQQLGVAPFDVQSVQADFVAADGHKWLLGPEGVALFYVREAVRDRLELNQYGWHMVENPGDFEAERWQPSRTARRFECGSPNHLGIHVQSASLSLFEEIGIESVSAQLQTRVVHSLEQIRRAGYTLLSPAAAERRAGIITFRPPNSDVDSLYRKLMQHRVLCAQRMGGIRFSPHFYTPLERIDAAFELVEALR